MPKSNVLVTGSNSGFGRLICLARRGHTVFATMRSPTTKNAGAASDLRAIAQAEGLTLHVLELDVTDDNSVSTAVQSAEHTAGHLDVVVNNAGYAVGGLNETMTSEQVLSQLDTNVVGAHRVNRAALPALRRRRAGLLVHISSTMGRLTAPFNGIYCGSKWALEAMAESYRYELGPTGVEVSIVQPGVFKTGIIGSTVTGADAKRADGYGLEAAQSRLVDLVHAMHDGPGASDPEEVARAVVALVEAPAGTRPLRVVVDPSGGGAGTQALNAAAAEIQRGLLTALGMSQMID